MARTNNGNYILAGTVNFGGPPDINKYPFYIGGQQVTSQMFVGYFDTDWKYKWMRQGGSIGGGFFGRPAVDEQNNIYLGGQASPNFIFNGYTVTNTLGSGAVPLVVKLDTSGNNIWIKNASAYHGVWGISPVVTNGVVYMPGSYPNTRVTWDSYSIGSDVMNQGYDPYLARFNALTGAVLGIDTLKSNTGFYERFNMAAADSRGNVYLGGYMEYNLTIGTTGTGIVTAGGLTDMMLIKYGNAGCAGSVVPLKLLSFTARLHTNGKDVHCNWKTENEINTSSFVVQRSADGKEFTDAGTVQAAGNSSTTREYAFTDPAPFVNSSTLYYRLRMEDKDGSLTYSHMARVNLPLQQGRINVFPNPAANLLHVEGSDIKEIQLLDYLGRSVYKLATTGNRNALHVAHLPAGMYLLKAITGNNQIITEKVVIRK